MFRLIGKRQDHSLSIGLLAVLVLGIAGVLEYSGATNFITNFGPEQNYPAVSQDSQGNLN